MISLDGCLDGIDRLAHLGDRFPFRSIKCGIRHAKKPPAKAPTVGPKTTPYKNASGIAGGGRCLKLAVNSPYLLTVRFPVESNGMVELRFVSGLSTQVLNTKSLL